MKKIVSSILAFIITSTTVLPNSVACVNGSDHNNTRKPVRRIIVPFLPHRHNPVDTEDAVAQPLQFPSVPFFEQSAAGIPMFLAPLQPQTIVDPQLRSAVAQNIAAVPPIQTDPIGEVRMIVQPQVNRVRTYGTGYEATAVKKELNGFNYKNSSAYGIITQCFGTTLRLKELRGIIFSVQEHLKSKGILLPLLSRNAKRSFPLLVKYIEDNLDQIGPILPKVILYDKDEQPLQL
ncbi:MAG: hypothetical protein IJ758_03210 [Clostridia bacterium]|nr:hypothetical protein [Clostridia bacterium]